MKIRQGFVSNSSSSSFIIKFDYRNTMTLLELKELLDQYIKIKYKGIMWSHYDYEAHEFYRDRVEDKFLEKQYQEFLKNNFNDKDHEYGEGKPSDLMEENIFYTCDGEDNIYAYAIKEIFNIKEWESNKKDVNLLKKCKIKRCNLYELEIEER